MLIPARPCGMTGAGDPSTAMPRTLWRRSWPGPRGDRPRRRYRALLTLAPAGYLAPPEPAPRGSEARVAGPEDRWPFSSAGFATVTYRHMRAMRTAVRWQSVTGRSRRSTFAGYRACDPARTNGGRTTRSVGLRRDET